MSRSWLDAKETATHPGPPSHSSQSLFGGRQPGSFGWLTPAERDPAASAQQFRADRGGSRSPRRKQAGSLAWFRSGPGPKAQTASDRDENVKSRTLSAGTTTGCDTSPDSDADTATGSPIASMLLRMNTGDSL